MPVARARARSRTRAPVANPFGKDGVQGGGTGMNPGANL